MEWIIAILVSLCVALALKCASLSSRLCYETFLVNKLNERVRMLQVQANGRFGKLDPQSERLNEMMKRRKDIFDAGREARAQGLSACANPHENERDSLDWLVGYFHKEPSK